MFIIFNKDGSIYARTQSDFVMQGSNRVNKVFVGFVDNEYSGWSCSGLFTLPNSTLKTIPATIVSGGFEYLGTTYQGWVIELTSAITRYSGNVAMSVNVVNQELSVLYTYLANITINATGYPVNLEWDDSITVAQFNDYMAQLAAKLQANTMSVVVSENDLPAVGTQNVLYFVLGATSNTPYQVKMWTGSEYSPLGTINLSSFASKEEQAQFESEFQQEWQDYKNDVNGRISTINAKVDNAVNLTPIPVATVNDLPSEGATQPYVVQENGYWYYWNGTQWVQGQQYQAITGYKTLPIGSLDKAYVNNIVANAGSLCFVNLEGVGADLTNETSVGAVIGEGYAWYETESNKVLLWLGDNLYEVIRNPDGTGNYYLRNFVNATRVSFDNTSSGLDATSVQGAIDEMIKGNITLKIGNKSKTSSAAYDKLALTFTSSQLPEGNHVLYIEKIENVNPYRLVAIYFYGSGTYTPVRSPTTKVLENFALPFTVPEGATTIVIELNITDATAETLNASWTNINILKEGAIKPIITLNPKIEVSNIKAESVQIEDANFIHKNRIFYNSSVSLIGATNYNIAVPVEPEKTYTVRYKNITLTNNSWDTYITLLDSSYQVISTKDSKWNSTTNHTFEVLTTSDTAFIQIYTNCYAGNSITITGLEIFEGNINAYVIDEDISLSPTKDYEKYDLPILYLEGDISAMTKDNAVNLTYRYKNLTGTAEVKWQGSSSLAYPKKNYTVKFDNAFEAQTGWGNQRKYVMKADFIDPSHTRNVGSCKIFGKIIKSSSNLPLSLQNLPNGGAVDGFPVQIVINGVWQGLFNFNIPKDAWMLGMGSGVNEVIIGAEGTGETSQDDIDRICFILPPQVNDNDYTIEYKDDSITQQQIVSSLANLQAALTAQYENDEAFISAVSNYLYIDSVINYILGGYLMGNYDGIVRNYLLATYDLVKWFVVPYDLDSTYGLYPNGEYFTNRVDEPVATFGYPNLLFQNVWEHCKAQIKTRYNALIQSSGGLSYGEIMATILTYGGQFPRELKCEEARKWKTLPLTETNNANQIINYVNIRRKLMDDEIKNL